MPETICNDGYVCTVDAIDYDDINDATTCVALENGICSTCANILNAQKFNPIYFRDNPIKAIFDIDKPEEKINAFWNVLTEKCGIVKPSTSEQKPPAFYIAEPDYKILTKDHATIQLRIQQLVGDGKIKNDNASAFINAIYKIAVSPSEVDFSSKSEPKTVLTSMFKQILQDERCTSQLIHEPLELPINIQTFFQQLVDVPESYFIVVVNFLDKKTEACLEIILDACMTMLDTAPKRNAGGNNAHNKQSYKKQSYKKQSYKKQGYKKQGYKKQSYKKQSYKKHINKRNKRTCKMR
jgi:hypothetical protein